MSRRSSLRGLLAGLSLVLAAGSGCAYRSLDRPYEGSETEILLRRADFATVHTHANGRASCQYLLLMPLCSRQDIASQAWTQMREQAGLEGRPAHLINLREERLSRWNFFGLYFQEIYTVSADVIAFDEEVD